MPTFDPAWSPDGKLLAFSAGRDRAQDVFVFHVGSGWLERFGTTGSAETAPSFSPDSRSLLFTRRQAQAICEGTSLGETGSLIMRSLATGREQTVADLGGRVQWAPDGRRVLVSALICSSKQTLALRVVNVGTGRSTYLARIGPAWSLAFKTAIARWAPGGPSRGSIALLVAAVGG